MQTSATGIAVLEQEEGVVLRAYRDPVGIWTIGAGLTAASGVIKPKAGMVISRAEATNLLQRALRGSYEPAVAAAMPEARQHEFDAGVGFHWNTGAIGRASWVKAWRGKRSSSEIRIGLLAWNKAGGRVMPGLTHRREREADMLLQATYPLIAINKTQALAFAKWGLSMTGEQIEAVRKGLLQLGYDPGKIDGTVAIEAARKFQADCGLTVDGIIGRATLSTLQRRLDARSKSVAPTLAAFVAIPAGSTELIDQLANLPGAGGAVAALAGVWFGKLVFQYRDAIAAEINSPFPRLAAILRSF